MRVSCNFVNVYTIRYRIRAHMYTRTSLLNAVADTGRASGVVLIVIYQGEATYIPNSFLPSPAQS